MSYDTTGGGPRKKFAIGSIGGTASDYENHDVSNDLNNETNRNLYSDMIHSSTQLKA